MSRLSYAKAAAMSKANTRSQAEPNSKAKAFAGPPSIRASRFLSHSGLTLIELVVVLAILAVLAGVAVRSLEPIADQARYEATQKSLESAKNAIVEDRIQSSGARHVSGFVSDMGRLPESLWMLVDRDGATAFSTGTTASNGATGTFAVKSPQPLTNQVGADRNNLAQINVRPALFAGGDTNTVSVHPAGFQQLAFHLPSDSLAILLSSFGYANRLGPTAEDPANPTDVDCSGVSLQCGWRGPYLTLPDPRTGVVDGWGRQIGLGAFPNEDDDVHLIWTAVTNQYSDQTINVQRLAFQTVAGRIVDANGAARIAEVVLVYPDLTVSLDTLSVMADADGINNDGAFEFNNVPVGVRALVFNEVGGTAQAIRYLEVTPMQQANLTMRITEF